MLFTLRLLQRYGKNNPTRKKAEIETHDIPITKPQSIVNRSSRDRSGFSPAAGQKKADQIEKETDEHRTSNVQHRTSNECILSILKKISRSDSILRNSIFVIRYSAVRCLIRVIQATRLIIKKPCHFGVVSYKASGLSLLHPDTRHLTPFMKLHKI
jgi:hypothetical protein